MSLDDLDSVGIDLLDINDVPVVLIQLVVEMPTKRPDTRRPC